MEAPDLDRRLSALEARLDEMAHAQRMHASAATRRFEGDLNQLRQDLTSLTSRMALAAELQELRKLVEAGGGAQRTGEPGWQEAAELVPRLMTELGRLREEVQAHRPGGTVETDLAGLREGMASFEARLAPLDGLKSEVEAARKSLRTLDERLSPLEGLRSEVAGLVPKVAGVQDLTGRLEALEARRVEGLENVGARLDALEGGAPALETRLKELERALVGRMDSLLADVEGLNVRLETVEGATTGIQSWLEEVDTRRAALQTRLDALEKDGALATLKKRVDDLAKARVPDTEGAPPAADSAELADLRHRLEALEGRPAGDPSMAKRLEALEGRATGDPALAKRVEALESRPAPAPVAAGGPSSEALDALGRRLETLEASDSALLALRVESIELGLGVERERVREVFGDLLEEHGLMLRSLESRLTLLLQDVHRLGEELKRGATA